MVRVTRQCEAFNGESADFASALVSVVLRMVVDFKT